MTRKQLLRVIVLFFAFMISFAVYYDGNETIVNARPASSETELKKESVKKKKKKKSKQKEKKKKNRKNEKNKKNKKNQKNKKNKKNRKNKKKDRKDKKKDKKDKKSKEDKKKDEKDKKEEKDKKTEEKTENNPIYYPLVESNSGVQNSGEKPSPNLPEDNSKNNFGMKVLADYEAADVMTVAKTDKNNIHSVQENVYRLLTTENEKAKVYFLDLESHVLILDLNNRLKSFANAGHETIKQENKIYCLKDKNSNILSEAGNEDLAKKDNKILVFQGSHKRETMVTAEYVIGLPGNRYTGTVAAFDSTKEIAGICFDAETANLSENANKSLLTLKSTEPDFDCLIDHNSFHFKKNDKITSACRGIGIFSLTGKLTITQNSFEGENRKNGRGSDNAHGMIDQQSRIKGKKNTSLLIIKDNTFKDIYSTGVLLYASDREAVHIEDNVFNGSGEEAVKISPLSVAYPAKHNLILTKNKISRYGLNKNEGYTDAGAGPLGEVNSGESGICLNYYDGVQCGSFVNNTWHSSSEQLSKKLKEDNLISGKLENDALDGVLDSAEVTIGQKGYYVNTAEKINQNKYSTHNKSYVIVKNENGNVSYGQDPEDITAQIKIKHLYILGTGSGVVTLPSTLYITGDLKVDLPNGSIKVNAKVDGKKEINAGTFKHSVTFKKVSDIPVPRGNAESDFGIAISDIKNDKGLAIKDKHLKFHVILGKNVLSESEYYYKNGVLFIKKDVLNKLVKNEKLMIKVSASEDNLSEVSSEVIMIEVSNLSKAKFEYSAKKFSHMDAEQPITVKIKEIKNNKGESISAKDSHLAGNVEFRIFGQAQEKRLITVDDTADTVTLSKELLNYLYATKYEDKERNNNFESSGKYEIVINDKANHVYDAIDEVSFEIVDKSGVDFVFEEGMTFTQGEAPKEGITLSVKNVVNTKGEKVSPSVTMLKNTNGHLNMNVEPFPVQRDDTEFSEIIVERDEKGEYIREVINPRYVKIDDEKDTLTFTREYLNRIVPGKGESTDRGIKTFVFKYTDTSAKVDVRSQKVALYIKFKEKKLSKDVGISFKDEAYRIENNTIVKNTAEPESMVAGFLKWVIKQNPRQQLHILREDKILRSFDSIQTGDKLRVIAEDGETTAVYTLNFEVKHFDLSRLQFDKTVIKEVTEAAVIINRGQGADFSIKKFLAALTLPDGMTAKVVSFDHSGEYEPVQDSTLTKEMVLVLLENGVSKRFEIRFSDGKEYRALLIGNQDYGSEKMNLSGPENDLRIMSSLFRRSKFDGEIFKDITVKKNLRKAELLKAVQDAFKDATDEDISYIYYSGHGNNLKSTGQSYLCTVDDIQSAQSDEELAEKWVSTDELKEILDQVHGTKVVILDCCNAGGFIGKKFEQDPDGNAAFINSVKGTFDKKPNYFTTNDYKVIVASSENEYSFEDKKKAIGKFTEQFTKAATMTTENYLLGDSNKDGLISLDEMYNHLMNAVESISHIQVFPHKDSFCLLKEVVQVELNTSLRIRVKDSAYEFKYKEHANSQISGMILSNKVKIDEKMTVKEFLGHIEKDHVGQSLSVVRMVYGKEQACGENELLKKGESYLKVKSERGDMVRYPISVNTWIDPNQSIDLKGNVREGITVTVNKDAGVYAISLTKQMSTVDFIKGLRNANRKNNFVYKVTDKTGQIKKLARDVMLITTDKLEVSIKDTDIKQVYNITVLSAAPENPGVVVDGDYKIENNVIKSGTKKLTEKTQVRELLKWLSEHAQVIMKNADERASGIYSKNSNPPFGRPKTAGTLAKGDRLIVKDFLTFKSTVYEIELAEDSQTEPPVTEPSEEDAAAFAKLEPDFGDSLKIVNGEIKSGSLVLTNQVKVKDVLAAWKNKTEFDRLGNSAFIGIYMGSTNVFTGKPNKPARALEDTIGYEDKLLLIDKKGNYRTYKFVMSDEEGGGEGPIIVPPVIHVP